MFFACWEPTPIRRRNSTSDRTSLKETKTLKNGRVPFVKVKRNDRVGLESELCRHKSLSLSDISVTSLIFILTFFCFFVQMVRIVWNRWTRYRLMRNAAKEEPQMLGAANRDVHAIKLV
ncbi:hypothetical protein CRE_25865 [Caenorhabditis remanei]|uniref:Uncharacterized protein n=1 Tax=Caenorhabditis remanei TaxID=31234 RepID=E3NDS7_CAERE|nr:hypothetical protein CRE_25865 [Caenorhabditis remanei]